MDSQYMSQLDRLAGYALGRDFQASIRYIHNDRGPLRMMLTSRMPIDSIFSIGCGDAS